MNDVVWWVQVLIWLLIGIIVAAVVIQVKFGGIVNFVRVRFLGKAPKTDNLNKTGRGDNGGDSFDSSRR